MLSAHSLRIVDLLLQEAMWDSRSFGEKPLLLDGDLDKLLTKFHVVQLPTS